MVTSRRISVAGVGVEFRGDSKAAEIIDRRYEAFFLEPQGLSVESPTDALVELDLYPPSSDPWAGALIHVANGNGEISLTGPGIEATIKEDASEAFLRAPCNERSIDGVLRYLLSQQILLRGGLLVHASAVLHRGKAWVFAGASGSGKSTIAENLGGRCLGDEAIALLPTSDRVIAHATPYWCATPADAEIAALVFHQQSDHNALCALSQSRGLAKLVSCTGPLMPTSQALAMERGEELVEKLAPNLLRLHLDSVGAIRNWLPQQMDRYS